ncbi:MAG: ArsR family transcriptional regulator [Haloglomus sp.]
MPGNGEQSRPREAFSLLGHDLRLDILLALLDHWQAARTEPRRYSDLMRAVGLQDSGKFNYHLGRLRGVYVRKRDDGYVPTAAATALYRAVLAHRPTRGTASVELDPGLTCPACGADMAAEHEAGFLSLRCPACDDLEAAFTYPFPENGLEGRPGAAVVRAAYDRARAEIGLARRGQCPDCGGRTSRTVDLPPTSDGRSVTIDCGTCTWGVETGILLPVLSAPPVGGALSAVGLSADAFAWKLPTPETAVVDADPWQAELRIEGPDGTATVTIDGDLHVRTVEHPRNE